MTIHEYERYRDRVTGDRPSVPPSHALFLAVAFFIIFAICALLFGVINADAQSVEQGGGPHGSSSVSARSEQPRPAPSTVFTLAAVSFAGLQGVDYAMTTRCVQQGRCSEANPAMRGVVGSPLKFALLKGAVTSGAIYGAWSLRKTHPKAATWLLVGMAGAQAIVVASNARQLR